MFGAQFKLIGYETKIHIKLEQYKITQINNKSETAVVVVPSLRQIHVKDAMKRKFMLFTKHTYTYNTHVGVPAIN